MIRPLRRVHRIVFFALGVALPVVFLAGTTARHVPLPVVKSEEDKLLRRDMATELSLNHGAGKITVHAIQSASGGPEREFRMIPQPGFVAPDVFVYWSEFQPDKSVDATAKFLGRLGSGERYAIPTGSDGFLIVYSVARSEVLGSFPVGRVR